MTKIEHNFDGYVDRVSRYDFMFKNFPTLLDESGSILDVGCDDNHLKEKYGSKVFGIDIEGNPDRKTDLEKESLRFLSDNSYDLSICTEVLEHIDNFHEVLDDMVRVTKGRILISLPNCTSTFRLLRIIRWDKTGKFYGLPPERPVDRHKWYFSYKEIINFFEGYAEKNNLDLERVMLSYSVVYPNETRPLNRAWQRLKKLIFQVSRWHNMSKSVFIVLKNK